MSQRQNIWTKEIKFIVYQILRGNWYNFFFRCYITPKDIARAKSITRSIGNVNTNTTFYHM